MPSPRDWLNIAVSEEFYSVERQMTGYKGAPLQEEMIEQKGLLCYNVAFMAQS
jgi:hypothetical protein